MRIMNEELMMDAYEELETNLSMTIDDDDGNNDNEEVVEPIVEMEFDSLDALRLFFKRYAFDMGFGWKVRTSKKDKNGDVYYVVIACSREGTPTSKGPSIGRTFPTQKANCQAKINALKNQDGKWVIKKVDLTHCHDLSPTKARMFKKNKSISMHVKRTIDLNDEAGVRLNKTFQSLVHEVGGHDKLPFVEKDIRNYINKERRLIGKAGDGKALLDYFNRMKTRNKEFWYDVDFDDEFRVRNIFWADARSRAAYEYFGDVVSFDTTYLTNKYEMPFAAFVGVNHHGQSVLLGCGLLGSEDASSFVWLFQCWITCMSGKAPIGIVTDQCRAMKKAIEQTMANTRHRWCLWHIMKKIPEKLGGFDCYKELKRVMKEAVYDSVSIAEFEDQWTSLLNEFELQNNEWLCQLYEERARWVPIFLKADFWAGLSTTQRSESIHAFFDGYLTPKTSLQQFVKQYDNALMSKAEKEFEADFRTMNTTINCATHSGIERQFQMEYTHAKFCEVQAQFREKMNCTAVKKFEDASHVGYNVDHVFDIKGHVKERSYVVKIDRTSHEFTCECLMFEFKGIICCHALCAMALEKISSIPSKYILDRWSKKIKRRHSKIKCCYDGDQISPDKVRFDNLCKEFYEAAEMAAESVEYSTQLRLKIQEFVDEVKCSPSHVKNAHISRKCFMFNEPSYSDTHLSQVDEIQDHQIHSPVKVNRKGRPRTKRIMSTCEKVVNKSMNRNKRLRKEASVEEVLTLNGGSRVQLESSIEVAFGMDNNDRCGQWMGGCKDQNVAVPVFGDNYIGSQSSSVQHTGYVSLLQSIDKDVGSYNHLYKSGSEFSGNIPPLNVDGVIDQQILSP